MSKYTTLVAVEETLGASVDVVARASQLRKDKMRLERELADANQRIALVGANLSSGSNTRAEVDLMIGNIAVELKSFENFDPKGLKPLIDQLKHQLGSGVAAVVAVNDGRASVVVGVTDDLTAQVNAVQLVQAAVEALGGKGGGGRPDMAQGGGPDGSKAKEALDAVRDALEKVAA